MPRSYKVMLAVFAFIVGLIFLWLVAPANAHEGYLGMRDPVTNNGCCGGEDCAPVPLDVGWVTPVQDGFQVDLTAEQAQLFNKNSKLPIHAMVPFARVLTSLSKATGSPSLYHICIVNDQLRCLFVVSST